MSVSSMTRFNHNSGTYRARYISWAIIPMGFVIISILLGFINILQGNEIFFLKDSFRVEGYEIMILKFFTIILAIGLLQNLGFYITTNKATKRLEIEMGSALFYLFNRKVIEIIFSDIESFDYTEDGFKNFEFNFKDGSKKIIPATIQNKEQAYNLIKENITKANSNHDV